MHEHLLADKGKKRKRLSSPKLLCWKIVICGNISCELCSGKIWNIWSVATRLSSLLFDCLVVSPPLTPYSLLLHVTTHVCLSIPFPSDCSGGWLVERDLVKVGIISLSPPPRIFHDLWLMNMILCLFWSFLYKTLIFYLILLALCLLLCYVWRGTHRTNDHLTENTDKRASVKFINKCNTEKNKWVN